MLTLTASGPFSLAASSRFLEGFAPAGRGSSPTGGPLRLAFPVEGSGTTVGVALTQSEGGAVLAEVVGEESPELVEQLGRMLSLDVEATSFPAVAGRDPVVGRLVGAYPGLRPVGFHSPYEAACWAVVGQRLRITQAASIAARIRGEFGQTVTVAGVPVAAFPEPRVLARVAGSLPLPEVKQQRLAALATAAGEGRLDGARLRALTAGEAIADVSQLPGIGPFSAELVVIRGAGHPDRFPVSEARLHDSMRELYGCPDADVVRLATIAEGWAPFRSWVSLLIRTDREARTGEIARGRRH